MSLIVGTNKQMAEFVALKRLKAFVHEKRHNSITYSKYLVEINYVLSLYSLVEDERFDYLMDKEKEENDPLTNLIKDVSEQISRVDMYSAKSKTAFLVTIGFLLLLMFVASSVLTWDVFFFIFILGVLYLSYAQTRIYQLYKPLRELLFKIVANSEPTYGKKSIS